MLLYLALAWNEQNPSAQQRATEFLRNYQERSPEWRVVFETTGLAVSCRIAGGASRIREVYRLQSNAGVILGKLFQSGHEAHEIPAAVEMDERQTARILETHGRHLIQRYWGHYIAFLRDATTRTTWVLRDPTGSITCYTARRQDIDVYFLRLEDFARLGEFPTTISRGGLISHGLFPFSCTRVTGLNEVTALLAGECVELQNGQCRRSFYWNPLEIAGTDVVEDAAEAVRLTRQTVRSCVHAWASCFDTIVHNLSGGLDSSIVLACLSDAPSRPTIVCRNVYGRPGSEADERPYARLVARQAGYELIETPILEDGYFGTTRRMTLAPQPYFPMRFHGDAAHLMQLAAASTQIPAQFDGNGGDELFFHGARDAPALADYLHRCGLRRRAWHVALDDARADQVALWRVMRAGILQGLLVRRPWNYRRRLWRLDLQTGLPDSPIPESVWRERYQDKALWHPLYVNEIEHLPPGKAYQCATLNLASENRCMAPPSEQVVLPAALSPLRSQPLIELSLRIPTYVLRTGGQDRGIARRAFQAELPPEIICRRSKGSGEHPVLMDLRSNLAAARDRLLNGRLVRAGYLDRSRLAAHLALTSPNHVKWTSASQLYGFFTTELWLEGLPAQVPLACA